MQILKALSGTQLYTNSLFIRSIFDFKLKCVHDNLHSRPAMLFNFLSLHSTAYQPSPSHAYRSSSGFQPTSGIKVNGRRMLNVQTHRPFAFISLPFQSKTVASGREIQVHQRCFMTTVNVRMKHDNKNNGHEIPTTNSSLVQHEEEEDDEEEFTKQEVWDYGPTPTPSFNFAAYANEAEIVQKLVNVGVNLSRVELKYGTLPFILKLDFDRDVTPIIECLTSLGVDSEKIGWYLTMNPFILEEDIRNLEKRVDYLRLKQFDPEHIIRILNTNPFWLSFSVTRIDRRLGFFQSFFRLTGDQVRLLALRGPNLITSNVARIKDVTFTVKEEMGFKSDEIVRILLERPRIWREKPSSIRRRFDYLHNTVKFSHEAFLADPDLLLVRESRLKNRIGFLEHLGRAQFDPSKPNYVTFKMIYKGDDAEFASDVAKSSVLEYNNYLKSV